MQLDPAADRPYTLDAGGGMSESAAPRRRPGRFSAALGLACAAALVVAWFLPWVALDMGAARDLAEAGEDEMVGIADDDVVRDLVRAVRRMADTGGLAGSDLAGFFGSVAKTPDAFGTTAQGRRRMEAGGRLLVGFVVLAAFVALLCWHGAVRGITSFALAGLMCVGALGAALGLVVLAAAEESQGNAIQGMGLGGYLLLGAGFGAFLVSLFGATRTTWWKAWLLGLAGIGLLVWWGATALEVGRT